MAKIIFLKGLPGSGKSTFAKDYIKNNPAKIVNKDSIRSMLDDGVWSKSNEKTVLSVQKEIVADCLFRGHDVVLDNTHLDVKHEEFWQEFCELTDYDFEVKFFDVHVDECIRRDKQRAKPVGAKVILDMYNRYLKPEPVKIIHDRSLPDCAIFDIDGTLAQKGDRSIYDASKCHLDTVIEPVRDILYMTAHSDIYSAVFIMSGREEIHRKETEEWLRTNNIQYTELFMRKAGDKRCDSIVKKELYEENIKGKYNVRFVIDDRLRVLRAWHDLGLFTFNVNQTNEEF